MLYVIYGEDTIKAKEKVNALVKSLLSKRPDALFFRIDSENFSPDKLDELIESRGLFEHKYIVELDRVLANKESKELIFDNLKELQEAEHIFVVFEEKLLAPDVKKLEKHAAKIQNFPLKNVGKKEAAYNVFPLADALGRRDKKQLWVLYREAIGHNVEPENIQGTLFWQLKTMLLVKDATAGEIKKAGLHPFVASKAGSFSKNYSREELEKLSGGLVRIYHEARRGRIDFETALEKWILTLV